MVWLMLRTMVALAIVLVLAWIVLRGMKRRMRSTTARDIELVGHLALAPKRHIHLVRIGKTIWALGYHEQGMTVIGTVPPEELNQESDAPINSLTFRDLMADVQLAWQTRRQRSTKDE